MFVHVFDHRGNHWLHSVSSCHQNNFSILVWIKDFFPFFSKLFNLSLILTGADRQTFQLSIDLAFIDILQDTCYTGMTEDTLQTEDALWTTSALFRARCGQANVYCRDTHTELSTELQVQLKKLGNTHTRAEEIEKLSWLKSVSCSCWSSEWGDKLTVATLHGGWNATAD